MGDQLPVTRTTISVPKPLARFLRSEARRRELSRDVLLGWLLDEAARQEREAGVQFEYSKPINEKLSAVTRVTADLPNVALAWVEQQAVAEDVSRNQVVAAVLREGQDALVRQAPSRNGFRPSERRLRQLERDLPPAGEMSRD